MPITGLTDRQSLRPRFPRLGKLRKGGKKPERGFGKDLDHFRFTSDEPEIVEAFVNAYGNEPSRLEVYLPHATPEENFETWMEEWSAGGLLHRCDGETSVIHRKSDGSYAYDSVPCPYADGKLKRTTTAPGCKIIGRLSVVLPDLLRAGFVGYVVLETGSTHDVRNIMSALLAVEQSRPQGVQGIPFTLRRYKDTISTPGGEGKRARREKSLVSLVPSPTWVESRMALSRTEAFASLPSGEPLPAAGPDDYEPPDEDDDGDASYAPALYGSEVEPEAPQTEERQAKPPVTNGKAARPLDPLALRDLLSKKVAGSSNEPATVRQVPFVARKFQEAFEGEKDAEEKYHSCLRWLWDADSAGQLTLAQAKATLDWLLEKTQEGHTGDTPLHEHAPEEAHRVLREAMKAAGQQDLFETV